MGSLQATPYGLNHEKKMLGPPEENMVQRSGKGLHLDKVLWEDAMMDGWPDASTSRVEGQKWSQGGLSGKMEGMWSQDLGD